MVPPATIQTERLLLRPPQPTDAEPLFHAYASDPEVTRFLRWKPKKDPEEVRAFLEKALRNQEKGGEAHWVLEQRADRSPIGMFTVWFGEHGAELGFALSRAHWGRGYMTEAGTAIVEALLRDGSWHRIWAYCDCENEASARVLRKLGLGEEARLRRRVVHPNISDKPRDVIVFSRVR